MSAPRPTAKVSESLFGAPEPADLTPLLAHWSQVWGIPGLERRLLVRFSTRLRRSLGHCRPEKSLATLAAWLVEVPDLLAEVLCHEAAHAAVHQLYGSSRRPHGGEWRRLMEAAGFEARVRIPLDALPTQRRERARGAVIWDHRCSVCHAARSARRKMTRWRCTRCREAGLDGSLVITSRGRYAEIDA